MYYCFECNHRMHQAELKLFGVRLDFLILPSEPLFKPLHCSNKMLVYLTPSLVLHLDISKTPKPTIKIHDQDFLPIWAIKHNLIVQPQTKDIKHLKYKTLFLEKDTGFSKQCKWIRFTRRRATIEWFKWMFNVLLPIVFLGGVPLWSPTSTVDFVCCSVCVPVCGCVWIHTNCQLLSKPLPRPGWRRFVQYKCTVHMLSHTTGPSEVCVLHF